MLDIRHLRHLVAVAEEGTLQKASERLFITQPALTKSLHALEDHLAAELFTRSGRRLQLTELGHQLVDHGREILRSVTDTEKMVANWGAGTSGQITVGLGPAYTVLLSEHLIQTVVQDFESVQLRLETGDTESLVSRLLDDTIDLAVCDLAVPPTGSALHVVDLPAQPIVALVRADHPLTKAEAPSLMDLDGFPVGHSPAPAQFASIGTGLAALTRGASLCLSEHYDALVGTSRTSDLVTLLPLNLAQTYLQEPGLTIVELSGIPQASMPKILYRAGAQKFSALGYRLIEHISTKFAQVP
ncbi:MAG: LysR family transcriptional regulator [Kordiimonadaceae bacterium]|nr:LysR family transcriptional regulator [Kordiimonadaceae bacterium]